MRHTARVRVLNGVGHASGDIRRLQHARAKTVAHCFVEQLAVDALQCEVANIVHATGVEHRHDVRMMQTPSCLGLTHESLFDALMPADSSSRRGCS